MLYSEVVQFFACPTNGTRYPLKDKSLHQSIHVLYISRLGELVNAKYKTDNVSSKLHFFNERKKIKCGFRPCQRSHQMALGCHDPLYLVLPVWEAPECILLLLHGCTRSPPRLGVPLAIGLAVPALLPYRRHTRGVLQPEPDPARCHRRTLIPPFWAGTSAVTRLASVAVAPPILGGALATGQKMSFIVSDSLPFYTFWGQRL